MKDHKRSKDYQAIRKGYQTKIISHLAKGTNKNSALDLGCGTGQVASILSDLFNHVIGTDITKERIAEAKKTHKHIKNLKFKIEGAEKISAKDNSMDLVSAAQCFMYFDQKIAIPEIKRVLKPGAKLALLWKYQNAKCPYAKLAKKVILKTHKKFKVNIGLRVGESRKELVRSTISKDTLKDYGFTNYKFETLHEIQIFKKILY